MLMPYFKEPFRLKAFRKNGNVHIFEGKRFKIFRHPALHWGNSFECMITSDISDQEVSMSDFF